MYKEMMFWCDFCLFKISFNQLTYKLSFMRNWCFVLAIPRIEKQSREEAFKQSADDISVGTYVTIIKFTYEKQIENKLLFLDILVSNIKNLEISVFNRKTYTGLLLNYFSFVSDSYKYWLIKTIIDRMYGINSTWTSFTNI